MTYPVVAALRRARPDFYLHTVVTENLADLVKRHFPVDHVVTLPKPSGLSYFKPFWAIRKHYPDVWLNFPNSQRTDLEAFCSGATQRFGIQKKHRRFLLTHTVRMQPEADEHQVLFWYRFLQNFGLNVSLGRKPFFEPKKFTTVTAFGCFVGSANTPSKRWPTEHWRQVIGKLLQTFPNAQCVLLGSASDRPLCETVAENLPHERIQISAGKTDISALETQFRTLNFVISADSGGLHFANSLGLPTVALFGFTNPSYSKPFFDAPTLVLQSPSKRMEDLMPEVVFEKVKDWLEELTASK
jgi:ADP-heptose:LPS heptosyltransferase